MGSTGENTGARGDIDAQLATLITRYAGNPHDKTTTDELLELVLPIIESAATARVCGRHEHPRHLDPQAFRDDIVSIASMKFLAGAAKHPPSGNVNAWIASIVSNVISDQIRVEIGRDGRRRQYESISPSDARGEAPHALQSKCEEFYRADRVVTERERREICRRAFEEHAACSERGRESCDIVRLRYVEELSYADIAEMYDRTADAIRKEVERDRMAMRKYMTQELGIRYQHQA